MNKVFSISERLNFKDKRALSDIDELDFSLKPNNPDSAKSKYIAALKSAIKGSVRRGLADVHTNLPAASCDYTQTRHSSSCNNFFVTATTRSSPTSQPCSMKLFKTDASSKLGEKFYDMSKERMRAKLRMLTVAAPTPVQPWKRTSSLPKPNYEELVKNYHKLIDKELLSNGLGPVDQLRLEWIEKQLESYDYEDLQQLDQRNRQLETEELKALRELNEKIDRLLKTRG